MADSSKSIPTSTIKYFMYSSVGLLLLSLFSLVIIFILSMLYKSDDDKIQSEEKQSDIRSVIAIVTISSVLLTMFTFVALLGRGVNNIDNLQVLIILASFAIVSAFVELSKIDKLLKTRIGKFDSSKDIMVNVSIGSLVTSIIIMISSFFASPVKDHSQTFSLQVFIPMLLNGIIPLISAFMNGEGLTNTTFIKMGTYSLVSLLGETMLYRSGVY